MKHPNPQLRIPAQPAPEPCNPNTPCLLCRIGFVFSRSSASPALPKLASFFQTSSELAHAKPESQPRPVATPRKCSPSGAPPKLASFFQSPSLAMHPTPAHAPQASRGREGAEETSQTAQISVENALRSGNSLTALQALEPPPEPAQLEESTPTSAKVASFFQMPYSVSPALSSVPSVSKSKAPNPGRTHSSNRGRHLPSPASASHSIQTTSRKLASLFQSPPLAMPPTAHAPQASRGREGGEETAQPAQISVGPGLVPTPEQGPVRTSSTPDTPTSQGTSAPEAPRYPKPLEQPTL
jgi:hypothetical protein